MPVCVLICMVTRGGPWKITDSNTIRLSRKLSTVCKVLVCFYIQMRKGKRTLRLVISPECTGAADRVWRLSVKLLCTAPGLSPFTGQWVADWCGATFVQGQVQRKVVCWTLESRQAIMHQWAAVIYSFVSPNMKTLAQLAKTPFWRDMSSNSNTAHGCLAQHILPLLSFLFSQENTI